MTSSRSTGRSADKLAIFRLIPPKFAIALIVLAIVYALGQPFANRRFGWQLPSLATILELNFDADKQPESKAETSTKPKLTAEKSTPAKSVPPTSVEKPVDTTQSTQTKKSVSPTKSVSDDSKSLRFGVLKDLGNERFMSPAGLIYARGSEEGHRLKHLERHLSDQPDRPGSHGVFEGDMKQLILAIDDSYERASKGARGTTKRSEDGMTVYEATFDKAIGFIGGSTGKRKNNPETKKLRIVLSNKNVITAFPF